LWNGLGHHEAWQVRQDAYQAMAGGGYLIAADRQDTELQIDTRPSVVSQVGDHPTRPKAFRDRT
jgi:hypothetical protein